MIARMSCVVLAVAGLSAIAHAADTVEAWDKGAADLDIYMLMEGVGHDVSSQAVAGDVMVGWGLADRFCAHLNTTMQADGNLMNGGTVLGIGVFGTPIESDHVDLDLFLDVRSGGEGMGALEVEPSFELNWDAAPDLAAWGFYLRSGLAVAGRENPDKASGHERYADIGMTVGSYWSLDARRQLLIEYDAAWHDHAGDAGSGFETGGLALGYNVFLHDTLELINQVRVDLPQDDERTGVGFMVGLIATLPGGLQP